MITGRELTRAEIGRVWAIDRSEVIENVYYAADGGLVLKPEHYVMDAWPAGEADLYAPLLADCYDRGGWFYGLFDQDQLIGAAILDNKFIGNRRDSLQLKFLHLSRLYRGQGFGHRLFELSCDKARERGARGLYISATPSQNTIDFYLRLGCVVTADPDPELFALEPEDIHLEYAL